MALGHFAENYLNGGSPAGGGGGNGGVLTLEDDTFLSITAGELIEALKRGPVIVVASGPSAQEGFDNVTAFYIVAGSWSDWQYTHGPGYAFMIFNSMTGELEPVTGWYYATSLDEQPWKPQF